MEITGGREEKGRERKGRRTVQRSSAGMESMTMGTWLPQPNQDAFSGGCVSLVLWVPGAMREEMEREGKEESEKRRRRKGDIRHVGQVACMHILLVPGCLNVDGGMLVKFADKLMSSDKISSISC